MPRIVPHPEPGIPAKHPGICPICDEPFDRGARIVAKRGQWCHVECFQASHE